MKFKIDENLPAGAAEILRGFGFIADTVADENLSGAKDETVATASRSEDRILVTLDLDFANIRRLATALTRRNPSGELWVLDGDRIRFRQDN